MKTSTGMKLIILMISAVLLANVTCMANKYDDAYPLYQQKKYSEAIPLLEDHCTQYPKDPRGGYTLAQCYWKTKQIEKAVDRLKIVLEHHPEHDASQFLLGMALLRQKDVSGALKHLGEAVKLQPENDSYQYQYGYLLSAAKKYPEAAAALAKAVQIDSKNPKYNMEYAKALIRSGDTAKAEGPLKIAAGSSKTKGDALKYLGTIQLQNKDYDAAIASLRQATQADPKEESNFVNLGIALDAKLGDSAKTPADYDDIIGTYQKAIALDDSDTSAHYGLGKAYYMASRTIYEKAVTDEAIKTQALDLLEKAKTELTKVIASEPGHPGKELLEAVNQMVTNINNPKIIEEVVEE